MDLDPRTQDMLAGLDATEGGRRPTGVASSPASVAAEGGPPANSLPDPQVPERAQRRRFTADYKARILHEAERCSGAGQLGAMLRREGLYSSHLSSWRRQRDAGALAALTPRPRGRKARPVNPLGEENQRLARENQRLSEKLRRAELIIDVQKNSAKPWDFRRRRRARARHERRPGTRPADRRGSRVPQRERVASHALPPSTTSAHDPARRARAFASRAG